MRSLKVLEKRIAGARTLALLLGVVLLLGLPLRAQQPPQPQEQPQPLSPIKVEVKVVNIFATVRDKKGQIVSSLGKDDFVLQEDGRPQTITYFAKDTDLPLTLGLLVDTSESQRRVLDEERSASHSFLDNMLREDRDKAFVIHFDREVELLQDLTSSRQKLEGALNLVGAPQMKRYGDDPGQGPRQRGGGGTLLYDAVYLASEEVIQKQQGRKAVIVLSDGVDRGSKESLEDAIRTAQRADTIVYSILFAEEQRMQNPFGGFGGPGMGRHGGGMGGGGYPREQHADGKKVLDQISRETGGRMFEVSKKQTVDDIYKTIEEELRNQYSIGYTPAADAAPGYHKLHLEAKPKDLAVQARDGYYAGR